MNKARIQNTAGLTLIEVLVSITIFTAASVAIFQTYVLSMDRINHLTSRLYGTIILDNRILAVERMLRAYKSLPYKLEPLEPIDVGSKTILYEQKFNLKEVENFLDVFQIDLSLHWQESDREVQLTRSAYISDFGIPQP